VKDALIDWFMAQRRLMVSVLVLFIVLGITSYINIPKEADPDIPIPIVYVSIPYPGISPEDAERLLIRPMEIQLRQIEGVKKMTAIGSVSHASVFLEFDVNFNKDKAMRDVRDKVDLARAELPTETEEPNVFEFNASLWPVVVVTLSGDVPERTLLRLARELKDEIEAIPSVLEAETVGNREELLEVVVDPAKLASYNLPETELINAVRRNNQLIAAGSLDVGYGRFAVKVPGLFETREDVMSLVLRSSGDGVVKIGDIADIRRTFMDVDRFARFNGRPAIAIEVTKRIGENILSTIAEVRKRVAERTADWPKEIHVSYSGDASSWISDSLKGLESSILTAIILVMVVVVGALGLRTGMMVGLAIPTSFLIGFMFLSLGGLTINMMVMFGMVLSVGMLVDGAIIIVEYADRKMSEGVDKQEAYALAAKRMFWPVFSSTATTLAAFAPMLLWPGVAGKFMSFFPITLLVVLSASTLVALVFLPVVGSLLGKTEPGNEETMKALAASETGDLRELPGLTGKYAQLVTVLIRHPAKVLGAIIGALFFVIVLFNIFGKGMEYFVETEPDQANVLISARGNLSAVEKRHLVLDVEREVLGVDGISSVFAQTMDGSRGFSFGGGGTPDDAIGRLSIEFAPYDQRRRAKFILDEIREKTKDIPGIKVELRKQEGGPPTGKAIQIELRSDIPSAMEPVLRSIREYLAADSDVIDLEDTRPLPGIEWNLKIDREQAGRFGADVATIGAVVQLVTNGIKIGEYRPDDADDEVDIRVRYPLEARGIAALDDLRISTREGQVPITNFVKRVPAQQVTKVERVDAARVLRIRANVKDDVLPSEKVAAIKAWVGDANFDRRVRVVFRGADERQNEDAAFLGKAALGALFVMAVILLIQFNNFWHCALILSAVVMSTIGVMLGMIVMGQKFSLIMTGTGIVALAGIVVNNNIVLIDTFQHLVKQGFAPLDAVVRTGAQRLRPVFLTTSTTMIGLLPMMLNLSIDFFAPSIQVGGPTTDWWVQLATAVVFGMGFSTVLTLIVTPCLVALPYQVRETGRGFFWLMGNILLAISWPVRFAWRLGRPLLVRWGPSRAAVHEAERVIGQVVYGAQDMVARLRGTQPAE